MEPIFSGEVYCPQDTIEAIYNVLVRRRAHVVMEEPKPGSPLYVLKVEIPGIESFGFELNQYVFHDVGMISIESAELQWDSKDLHGSEMIFYGIVKILI